MRCLVLIALAPGRAPWSSYFAFQLGSSAQWCPSHACVFLAWTPDWGSLWSTLTHPYILRSRQSFATSGSTSSRIHDFVSRSTSSSLVLPKVPRCLRLPLWGCCCLPVSPLACVQLSLCAAPITSGPLCGLWFWPRGLAWLTRKWTPHVCRCPLSTKQMSQQHCWSRPKTSTPSSFL